MQYFSDQELGEVPLNITEISPTVWGGITAQIQSRIADGSFGLSFPELCPDTQICCGVNRLLFHDMLKVEVPELSETGLSRVDMPSLHSVMDVIQFCWQSVGSSTRVTNHDFLQHKHYWEFDKEAGQSKFASDINGIFHRNGLAFALTEQGKIERILPVEIGNALRNAAFRTKDTTLNELLETARQKFISPDERERREGLEKLWDAWEHIKSVRNPKNKSVSTAQILDEVAGSSSPVFRKVLENVAQTLTRAGNDLQIRHFEVNKEPLSDAEYVDYLFYSMFSLINLILSSTKV